MDNLGFFGMSGTGFHITFDNDWTVSVQNGKGTYTDNRNKEQNILNPCYSNTVEIAAWNKEGAWYHFKDQNDDVKGNCTPNEVLAFMNMIAKRED
jgi:hypothetical protein